MNISFFLIIQEPNLNIKKKKQNQQKKICANIKQKKGKKTYDELKITKKQINY